jgi:hypothetical protein
MPFDVSQGQDSGIYLIYCGFTGTDINVTDKRKGEKIVLNLE